MDINRIFDLFTLPPSGSKEENVDISVLDIYSHPAFKIGMFKKWIVNIPNAIKFALPHTKKNTDIDDLESYKLAVENQIFRKAFEFLEEIDLNIHGDVIKNNLDPLFKKTLDQCMEHFIEYEEYEKCIVLKNFQELFQKDLPL
jgi:hypothetical protein